MNTPAGRRCPRWAILALLAILLFDVWYRAHTFGPLLRARYGLSLWPTTAAEGEPLDCDEAAYAYMGRRMLRSDVLYRDLTENKPPLGYWLYALAVAPAGATELAIRVMPIPFVLATIALLWWIALRLSGPAAACLAAGIYAIASTDPYLFGNGSNLEHFLNFFSTAALACMVAAMLRPGLIGAIALAGLLLGCAALVKQVAVTHLLVFALAVFFRLSLTGGVRSAAARWRELFVLGAGFVLAWLLSGTVLFWQGALPEAYDDIVRYGGALVTDTPPDPNAPPWLERWFTGNADPAGV
ncbi:MAG TPA: glycosyltransferase family 39 protein, partial [Isosphaeraceae bacterium]|nr:glycosyltransferase family 39 protein [Isosphaeraceae bacterium]